MPKQLINKEDNMASENIFCAVSHLSATFQHIAEAASICIRQVGKAFATCADDYHEELMIAAVASPLQYHLYLNGSPRVRKKWKNALVRKYSTSRRRNRHV